MKKIFRLWKKEWDEAEDLANIMLIIITSMFCLIFAAMFAMIVGFILYGIGAGIASLIF